MPAFDRTATSDRSELPSDTRKGVPTWPIHVPPLPYAYDALEPHIDKPTMEIHHDKHHEAYVDNVNAALEGTPLADTPIEDAHRATSARCPRTSATAVNNNGGGHYNHSLFWKIMAPTAAASRAARSATRSTRRSAPSPTSRPRSRTPASTSSAPAGPGWSTTARTSRSSARQPGQPDLRRQDAAARRRRLGARLLPASTRTAAPTTSTRGGTSSTGTGRESASAPQAERQPWQAARCHADASA